MPTQEQLRQRTADIERNYPESLSDRIPWWARVLDIDRVRGFLRLLGLSGSEAARTPLTALPRVVEAQVDQAEIVDDMLGQLLASFGLRPASLAHCTTRARGHLPPRKSTGQAPSGEDVPLPYMPSPQVRRGILLNQIVAGGPFALQTLQAYLSEKRRLATAAGKANGLRLAAASITGRSMFHTPAAGTLYIGSPGRRRGLPVFFPGSGPTAALGVVTAAPSAYRVRIRRRPGGDHRDGLLPGPGMEGADRRRPDGDPDAPAEADAAGLPARLVSPALGFHTQCTAAAGHRPRRSECLHHVSARRRWKS